MRYTYYGSKHAKYATWKSYTGRWCYQVNFGNDTTEGIEDTRKEARASAKKLIDKREGLPGRDRYITPVVR